MFQQSLTLSSVVLLAISIAVPHEKNIISDIDMDQPVVDMAVDIDTLRNTDSTKEGNNQIEGTNQTGKSQPEIPFYRSPEHTKILASVGLPKCRVTQDEKSHNTQVGGRTFAYDVACEINKPFIVLAPTLKSVYIVAYIGHSANIGDYIVLKHGDERYVFGHTLATVKVGDSLKPGDVVGKTNMSGHTTGNHLHFEYWDGRVNKSLDGVVNEYSQKVCDQREWQFCVQKKVAAQKISGKRIYRKGQWLDYLQHGYEISKGDMDFIKTIEQESRWDPNASGDKNTPRAGDYSFGFCQFNTRWRMADIQKYKTLDNFKRIEMCYEKYKMWVADGVINNQLKGYARRNDPKNDVFTLK